MKKLILFILFFIITGQSIAAEYDTGGKNPDNDDVIYYFGYGSNLDEDYMRQWTPSLKFISLARLPNFEIQFRKYFFCFDFTNTFNKRESYYNFINIHIIIKSLLLI